MNQEQSVIKELIGLLLKIVIAVLVVIVLFLTVFSYTRCTNEDMNPSIREGDMIVTYRLDKQYQAKDVIVIEKDGKKIVSRVVAVAGDAVNITERGLEVNGFLQEETNIYTETIRYQEGIDLPVVLGEGEVFVLGDMRERATDSRNFGAVNISETRGKVIFLLRKRNF